jgi:hypothetical protein
MVMFKCQRNQNVIRRKENGNNEKKIKYPAPRKQLISHSSIKI